MRPMLVAIRRAIRWVRAAGRAQGRVRAVRIHRTLHGHRTTMRLTRTPNATRIGRQFTWVHTRRVRLKGDRRGEGQEGRGHGLVSRCWGPPRDLT